MKYEVWEHIYGDVRRKLDQNKYALLGSCLPSSLPFMQAALNEVYALVANPFVEKNKVDNPAPTPQTIPS